MIIGIMEVELYIYEANSLKDKRRVIKSLMERLRSRYNISVAEISLCDIWNKSIIGLSTVSNSTRQIDKILSKIFEFIGKDTRVEIVRHNIEIL